MHYDPKVVELFAGRLLKRARSAMFSHSILGAMVLGFLGLGIAAGDRETPNDDALMGAVIGLIVGAVVGAYLGRQRAFQLRLQAQTALVHVQIEKHMRAMANVASGRSSTDRAA